MPEPELTTPEYFELRHPKLTSLKIATCYLCGKALNEPTSSDHIIPDSFFPAKAPMRPQLPVHDSCHRQKSKEDRHFMRMLQLLSPFNEKAQANFGELLGKATEEGKKAWLVGHSKDIPNYKFAKTLTNGIVWGIAIVSEGQVYHQMKISNENIERFKAYASEVARGLLIRNVSDSNPSVPDIFTIQYAKATLTGEGMHIYNTVRELVSQSTNTGFAQQWGDDVSYVGSRTAENPNKGFVYIHFYYSVGILALFK